MLASTFQFLTFTIAFNIYLRIIIYHQRTLYI